MELLKSPAVSTPKLIALADGIQPIKFLLEADICTIGRWEHCQIVVQMETVSRLHAKIERDGPYYVLSDMESANGTYVNGQPIDIRYHLRDGDKIGLGGSDPMLSFVDPKTTLRATPLHYDTQTATFSINQKPVKLPPSLHDLLLHLYNHRGQLCTRESCARAIWKRNFDTETDNDALDRAVANLRQRLREVDPDNQLIEVRRSMGYILSTQLSPLHSEEE
jgi:DNA-binding winged helix-turn-helix (wHTH) protein